MAGFFGLFDFTKEGPGVKKNEKKKKGFFAFFEIYFRNFWSFVKIGPVYWLCSALFVTNGLAKVGITHVARSIQREKHSFIFSDFFESIKKNWKQGLILGTINVVAGFIFALDLWYFWGYVSNEFSAFAVIGLALAFFLIISLTFMKYYIWTMVITFTLSLKQLVKNSFHFVFINFGKNLLISLVMGAIYVSLYFMASTNGLLFVLAAIILIFVVPGFKSSLIQALTFPSIKKYIIDPYYAEHKGEDIEKRLALGLEIPEDEMPKEDTQEQTEGVFSDNIVNNK